MKLIITGHTSGLGKFIFDNYKNCFNVIGISRSTGYDLSDKDTIEKLIPIVETSDLLFNNAHIGFEQAKIIEKFYNTVPIITSGSIASDYVLKGVRYYTEKKIIEIAHKKYARKSQFPMLLLKMGYLENNRHKTQFPISFQQVLELINFWINNPRITMIEMDNVNSEKALFCGKNTTKETLDTEDK